MGVNKLFTPLAVTIIPVGPRRDEGVAAPGFGKIRGQFRNRNDEKIILPKLSKEILNYC